MLAITRSPRVLVKLPAAPDKAAFRFGKAALDVRFERLYKSIRPRPAVLGAAAQPEWHIMSPGSSGAEVNAWDSAITSSRAALVSRAFHRLSLPNRISNNSGP